MVHPFLRLRRSGKRLGLGLLVAAGVALAAGAAMAGWVKSSAAPDFSDVPGVVIAHIDPPTSLALTMQKPRYVGSPCIAILPNGDYLASHDVFGGGAGADQSGTTCLFRSSDRGQHWAKVAVIKGMFWGTVLAFRGEAYMIGLDKEGGNLVVLKSTDNGSSWTKPTDASNGLISEGHHGGTPCIPVVYDGRLWVSQDWHIWSAPADANLLEAKSWSHTNAPPQKKSWFEGKYVGGGEAQVMASPQTGVVALPRLKDLAYTAILRIPSPTKLTFDPEKDFVPLPGGEKKFGGTYDPVSGKFFVLTNPVLAVHADNPTWGYRPSMIRNAAAVYSSKDLRSWTLEKIFLYHPDIDHVAFQYLNFAIDGDDLAVVSRTSFDTKTGNLPPRGHDSNLMTFHRIKDFRHLKREFLLQADTEKNQVLRFEKTYTKWPAPLGKFTQADTFDGSPLSAPVALAQGDNGDVFVAEGGEVGRVLRFDAEGKFIGVVARAGAEFAGAPRALAWCGGKLYVKVDGGAVYAIDPATKKAAKASLPAGAAFGTDATLELK